MQKRSGRTYEYLPHYPRILGFNVDTVVVRFLHWPCGVRWAASKHRSSVLTICKSTSPVRKVSPSFFIQRRMVPSVMNGDIAGIIIAFLVADRWSAVQCVPSLSRSIAKVTHTGAFLVVRRAKRRAKLKDDSYLPAKMNGESG
jgi:hypothetical protein